MKLRIEAESAEEVHAKSSELLSKLAKAFDGTPIGDVLEKASTVTSTPVLRHEALKDLHGEVHARYSVMLDNMLAEVGQALDDHVGSMQKSAPDYTSGILADAEAVYDKLKDQLAAFGYGDEEFTSPTGKFFGFSVGELQATLDALKKPKDN